MSVIGVIGNGLAQGVGMHIGMKAGEKVLEKAGDARRRQMAAYQKGTKMPVSAYRLGCGLGNAAVGAVEPIWASPGAQKAAIRTANTQIRELHSEIEGFLKNGGKLPREFVDGWQKYIKEFVAFEKDAGMVARFVTGQPGNQALQYQRRTLEWRKSFVGLGGKPSTPAPTPPPPPGSGGPDMGTLKWAAIGVAGLVAFSYLKK